eukprot:9479189-Pyramimonas_sp.AAC.1
MTPKRLRTGDRHFSPSQNTASFYCDECQRGPIHKHRLHPGGQRYASTCGYGIVCRVARGTQLPLAVHWVLGGEPREAWC